MGGMTQAIILDGGVEMPVIGFGTWQVTGPQGYDAIRTALEAGYRHIDTATMYGNEAEVGRALRVTGLRREDVFITTKLPPERAGQERETLAASLRALGTDYVDLWLVHWPPNGEARPETWQEFLDARRKGLARAVGVSNYSTAQIDQLIAATGEAPAVNQIPWSPARHDAGRLAASRVRGVTVEGYSPLKNTNLADPVLTTIAANHRVTPAQVVLRWHIEHGIVVIPRSTDPARIASNLNVFGFELRPDEIARIDRLGG
jgi:diketogulonate reductase-like aldo/keto reductase